METRRGETELILRVDLDADPITGSLETAHGASRRFSGWIGLAAALQAVRAEPGQQPRQPPDGRRHSRGAGPADPSTGSYEAPGSISGSSSK